MTEWLIRFAPGTVPQWGMLVTLLTMAVGMATVWIRHGPARMAQANAATVIEHTDSALLRAEYLALNEKTRKDYHDLANEFQKLVGTQKTCEKALLESRAENRGYRDDMQMLLFLAKLLIKEIKRLDPDPNNLIIEQAEMTLFQLEQKHNPSPPEPTKSPQRQAAEGAVLSAERTLDAAAHTVDEIDAEEGKT